MFLQAAVLTQWFITINMTSQSIILSTIYSSSSFNNRFSIFHLQGSSIMIPFISALSNIEITIADRSTFTGSAITFTPDSP